MMRKSLSLVLIGLSLLLLPSLAQGQTIEVQAGDVITVHAGGESDSAEVTAAAPTPEILDIFVIDDQRGLPYPFDNSGAEIAPVRDATRGQATARRLLLHGRHLQDAMRRGETPKAADPGLSYAVDDVAPEEGERWLTALRDRIDTLLKTAQASAPRDAALVEQLTQRRAALRDVKNLALVNVTLKPGVTPGTKALQLGKSRKSWPLLFAEQAAALQFARHHDNVRSDSVPIFFPGDIGAVDLIYKTDIPFEFVEIELLHRPLWAKKGAEPKEIGHVRARRIDSLDPDQPPVYRSDPIHFVSHANPQRRPPENADAFYVNVFKGDTVAARLRDLATGHATPPVVVAQILGDPGELGELWRNALSRVAACDGDRFDGDPAYALKPSTRVSKIVVGELAKFVAPLTLAAAVLTDSHKSPIDFTPDVTLSKGDHAAALLIRDELIKLMRRLQPEFVPLANNRNGEAAALRNLFLASGEAGTLPMLRRYEPRLEIFERPGNPEDGVQWIAKSMLLVHVPADKVYARHTVYEKPLSDFIDDRDDIVEKHGIPAEQYDRWLASQIAAAAQKLHGNLGKAIGAADDTAACNLEELIVIAGQKAEPVVRQIVPRLVKKVANSGPPYTEYWEPDRLARAFVERLHLGGEAVAALEAFGSLDDSYKAMAVAAATAGAAAGASGLAAAAGFSTAATQVIGGAVLLAGDVVDVSTFGRKDIERYVAAEDYYDFAQGASLIVGEELLSDAEAKRQSLAETLTGMIMPVTGARLGLNELRYFRNINEGKALLRSQGPELLNNLDALTELERTQISAYYTDILTRLDRSGFSELDPQDRQAMRALAAFEDDIPTDISNPGLQSSTRPPPSGPSDAANPKGPYIGLDERLGTDFRNALNSDFEMTHGSRSSVFDAMRRSIAPEDGKFAIPSSGNAGLTEAAPVRFDETPLGQGSFNTAFRIDDDTIARIPGGKSGRPSAKDRAADKGGRSVFSSAGVDENKVRLVARKGPAVKIDDAIEIPVSGVRNAENIRLNPGDEIEIVENFKRGTLKDSLAKRPEQRMTAEEAIAYDKGVRELNAKGLIALDLKYDNFGFEPVAQGSKELRLVILDPGGIVPVKGRAAATARQAQSAIDGVANGNNAYSQLTKKYRFLDEYGSVIDARAIDLDTAEDIPFNPLGVGSYPRGRELSTMSREAAQRHYQTLRATDR